VVSAGDIGYSASFPDATPHVTAVGGTTLTRSAGGWSETVIVLSAVVLANPWLSVTLSVTWNVPPGAAYECAGLGSVDVAPSPKLQVEDTMVSPLSGSLLALVKVQARRVQAWLNAATGAEFEGPVPSLPPHAAPATAAPATRAYTWRDRIVLVPSPS